MSATTSPTRDALHEQKRTERSVAAKYRNRVAWRVVAETGWGIAAWISVIALALAGWLPYWIACPLNGWVAYLMYMPMHEATHGNVHGGRTQWKWLNDCVGWVSAVPLGFSYRSHQSSHMKHHAFTNDASRDPDFFIGGRLQDVVKKWAVLTALQLVLPLVVWIPGARDQLRARLRSPLTDAQSPYEMTRQLRVNTLGVLALAAFALAGYFPEALLLWWLPSRLGFLLIMLLFAWLPHHPHGDTTRYGNARVTLFPLSTFLLRGQNHHVLHHMFPRIPHYSLPSLFRELRPLLEAEGTRIEGSGAGPGAPPVGLRWRSPAQNSAAHG